MQRVERLRRLHALRVGAVRRCHFLPLSVEAPSDSISGSTYGSNAQLERCLPNMNDWKKWGKKARMQGYEGGCYDNRPLRDVARETLPRYLEIRGAPVAQWIEQPLATRCVDGFESLQARSPYPHWGGQRLPIGYDYYCVASGSLSLRRETNTRRPARPRFKDSAGFRGSRAVTSTQNDHLPPAA